MKDTYFSMLKPPTKAHSALNSVTDSARDNTTSTVFFLFRPRLARPSDGALLPGAAPFFLGLHCIRIFGSLHRRNLAAIFPGLSRKSTVSRANSTGANKDHRRGADGSDAHLQLGGAQDNRYQNSADAVAQQQPRRNADQTKQKCLLANDAFELPGRCANGFQKPANRISPQQRSGKCYR